jgi:hypothetical protein
MQLVSKGHPFSFRCLAASICNVPPAEPVLSQAGATHNPAQHYAALPEFSASVDRDRGITARISLPLASDSTSKLPPAQSLTHALESEPSLSPTSIELA